MVLFSAIRWSPVGLQNAHKLCLFVYLNIIKTDITENFSYISTRLVNKINTDLLNYTIFTQYVYMTSKAKQVGKHIMHSYFKASF